MTTLEPPALWSPSNADVEAANEQWGANCGPCSLAAILARDLDAIRPHLASFPRLRYMNPTHMYAALHSLAVPVSACGARLPRRGLAFIQWGGFESLPIRVQYQHTHWIAVHGRMIYEINSDRGWVLDYEWRAVMPKLIQEEVPGMNGKFSVRTGIEIPEAK